MFLDARVSCLVVGNYDEAMSNVSAIHDMHKHI